MIVRSTGAVSETLMNVSPIRSRGFIISCDASRWSLGKIAIKGSLVTSLKIRSGGRLLAPEKREIELSTHESVGEIRGILA